MDVVHACSADRQLARDHNPGRRCRAYLPALVAPRSPDVPAALGQRPKLIVGGRMTEHHADLIIDHYERYARAWDADRCAPPWTDRAWIDLFAGLLPAGGAVLDVGCGGGDPVATSLAARGLKLSGIDASPAMIALCKERLPGHRWLVADMRGLSLSETFDGVLGWDSFFHLKPDDQAAMFPVFAAHTALGGVLMFNAGPARGEAIGAYRGNPLYHASLDGEEYERLLDGAGFDLLEHVVGDVDKGGRVVWIARRR